jgi:ParB family chromosome partitioning protein
MASGEAKKAKPAAAKVEELTFRQVSVAPPAEVEVSIPLSQIDKGDRLRPVSRPVAEALAVSIGESGQAQAILVRPVGRDAAGPRYRLVIGGHRLEAAEILGRPDIRAKIRYDLTDASALLLEIDENLIRGELSPYDRAVFIQARLKAWADVHPDRMAGNSENISELTPKRGRPKNSDKMSEFLGDTPATMGFAAETAADLGLSDKTVRNALAVARGLSQAAHDKIRGSALGRSEGLLRQIAGVADKAEQLKVVEALSDGRAKSFSDALVIASGRAPVRAPERPLDTSLKAFQKAWKDAPASHRVAMLRWLSEQHLGPFDLVEIGSRAR